MAEEVVSLNLDGDFASEASSAASAAEGLADALDDVATAGDGASKSDLADSFTRTGAAAKGAGSSVASAKSQFVEFGAVSSAAYKKLEASAKAARAAMKATEAAADKEAFTRANRIPTELQASVKPASGFQNIVGLVEKMFGQKAAGSLVQGAAGLSEASDKLGQYAPLLSTGGKALGIGAAGAAAAALAIVAAAAALGIAAGKLLYAGLELGVQMSGQKQRAVGALSKLDKGKGEQDYQVAVKLAAELGMDSVDPVIDQYKKLLQAGFSREEIPLFVKAAADLGAVKGEEKAKGFLEQITKMANKGGKANAEALNAMAEAGVNTEDVLKRLAKKGETLDQVRARLKTGQVEAKALAKAAAESVEAQMGGIAGQGFFAKLNATKLGLMHLFDGLDMKPLEEALDSVGAVLKGPMGAELKASLTKLFDQMVHTFIDPFRGKQGEERLANIVKGVITLASVATKVFAVVAPLLDRGIDGFSRIAAMDIEGSPALKGLNALKNIIVGVLTLDPAQVAQGWNTLLEMIGILPDQAGAKATAIGSSVIDGIVSGITGGADSAIGAVVGVVQRMIDAAKSAQDSHSPSKKYEMLAKWNMQGLAKGANDNADLAVNAHVAAVDKTMAGAAGAGGAAGAPPIQGGAASGGPVTIIVQATPQTTDAHARAMGAAAGAAYLDHLRNKRRAQRDTREGRAA